MNPRFPLYIVSKGRWQSRLTVKALDSMHVPFRVIVEEQEFEHYASVIDSAKLLVLNPEFQDVYDTCDDLGDSKSRGPGPARNFAWAHALSVGAAWHWVLDDNIMGFDRLNRNLKIRVYDGVFFRAIEDFVLRYTNVAMAGPNYRYLAKRKQHLPPFVANTRIYSCNLIRNDLPFRWRGRYNEDTILSLDMLKAGWCTVQFNAFLQDKVSTQVMRGGCTDEFYAQEGTLPKSQMQVRVHPDVSRLMWRFGRPHHYVDYRRFHKNRLIRKADLQFEVGKDEFGMVLGGRPANQANA